MNPFFQKLRSLMHRRRKEDDLRDELQFHLDEETEERQAEGLPGDEARHAARRDLGSIALVKEETRAVWTWTYLEQLAQDCRYAVRTMAANKTFSVLAILSLALGIGANTAIYSFMDSLLLRSLPVSDPESLAVLNWGASSSRTRVRGAGYERQRLERWEMGSYCRDLSFSRLRAHADQLRRGFLERVRLLPHTKGERDGEGPGRAGQR